MPDPDELARMIRDGGFAAAASASGAGTPATAAHSAPVPSANDNRSAPANFGIDDVHGLLEDAGRFGLAVRLNDFVAPVRVEPGVLHFARSPDGDDGLVRELAEALLAVTGSRWDVQAVTEAGAPTRAMRQAAAQAADAEALHANPLVQAGMAAFPGARLINE
jgi:DNA polymerase-3 subunit gamma/tau